MSNQFIVPKDIFLQIQMQEKSPKFSEELLLNVFKTYQTQLDHLLIPKLSYLDPRAQALGGVNLLKVSHQKELKFSLIYQFDWAAYGGCVGLDESGTEENKVYFNLTENGEIKLDLSALGHD